MEGGGASVKKNLTFNFKIQGKLLIHFTIDQVVLVRHIGLGYLSLKENECLGGHIIVIDSQPVRLYQLASGSSDPTDQAQQLCAWR